MDPIKIEKFQAMKRYKKKTFLHSLINYILTTVVIGMFLSCPLWLPKLISSVKYLPFVFIPTVRNAIFSPKCLFFICNVIIVFLLNESSRSESVPLKPDVYDEYLEQSRSLTKMSGAEPQLVTQQEKKPLPDFTPEVTEEEAEEVVVEIRHEGEEDDTGEEEEEDDEFLSADELKKKFEDFIARINEQRRVEARMLICKNS